MRLVTALLVKNEGAPDRYLARVLARCAEFSDDILVLDDGSTDDTVEIAKAAGCIVKQRPQAGAWGNESPARAELWERGTKLAKDGWLLICDADMLLRGDPRPYCLSWELNSWAWPLVDLWDSEETFRVDGPWAGGPNLPRPWLFKPSEAGPKPLQFGPPDAIGRKNWHPQWQDRGIHVGHCPQNFELRCGVAQDLLWLHLAYLRPEHRKAKLAAYMAVKDQLSPFELQHAQSIAD